MPVLIESKEKKRSNLLGYPVDSLDLEEAVRRVCEFAYEPRLNHVVAINANKLWLAERHSDLHRILLSAEMVIPEYAAVWGCWVLGCPLRGHVGGVMLMKASLPSLAAQGIPVFFLGAKQEVIDVMVTKLKGEYPNLRVAGYRCGYFTPAEEAGLIGAINDSGAKVLFVAMGSPRQELWVERNREKLRPSVALGVGGSFDVIAGIKKDAPQWMRHGGEWLYRLAQDPRNLWKRYLTTNPWFVWRVLTERLRSGLKTS